MTKPELELVVQKFLDDCEPRTKALQREVNVAFLKEYGDHPRLAAVTDGKEHWAITALGSFTAGYIRGMEHHAPEVKPEGGFLDVLKRIWKVR